MRGENIIAFSKDWESDWTSNHHVLSILSRKNRVLWINSLGMRPPSLSSGKDWKKMVKKLIALAQGVRKKQDNLYTFTPLVIPFRKTPFLKKLNQEIVIFQIRILKKLLRMEDFQLWTFLPNTSEFMGKLGEKISVYYCTDNWRFFPYLNGEMIAEEEKKLLARVKVVFTSSRALYEEKIKSNPHTFLSTHGVNSIFFSRREEFNKPEDLKKIPPPILGFYGWLRDTIDEELLVRVGKTYNNCSLVLIGKVDRDFRKLKKLKNVFFLGQKPYYELPSYASFFDIALIPYKMSRELMISTNPVKLKEYLALGLPVVATDLHELYPYRDLCWIARNHEEFLRGIGEALQKENREKLERARERMKEETWEKKVEKIERILEKFLE